eukprot:gene3512-2463_t
MVIGPYDLALDVFGFRYLCVYLAGCFESLICIYVTYDKCWLDISIYVCSQSVLGLWIVVGVHDEAARIMCLTIYEGCICVIRCVFMRELGSCCVRFYFVYRGILKMIEFGCNRFLFVITIGYMFYIRYDVSLIDCIPLLWVSPEFMLLCLWIVFVYHILQAVVDSLGYKFTVSFAGLLSATWCAVALFILTVVRLFGVAFARHCDFGCIFCGLYCDAGHLSDAWVLSLQGD